MQKYCQEEKQLMYKIKEYSCVIIYGAGMVGELVVRYLIMQGQRERVFGFAVSQRGDKKERDFVCGVPVYGIEEWKAQRKQILVIVATLPDLHEEMGRRAEELLFGQVIFITEKLCKELSRRYMQGYKNSYPLTFPPETKTRILFMASDNNKVSGAFLCMAELCVQLREQGIGTAVILPHYGTGASLLEEKDIPYTYIESKDWAYQREEARNPWKRFQFIIGLLLNCKAKGELVPLLREQQVDLVHCNTTYTYIGAVAAKECGLPFVWHLRENLEHQGYGIFRRKKALQLMQEAGKIIAVSHYIKDLFSFDKEGLLDVLYDAVDMEGMEGFRHEILQGKVVRMIQVGVLIEYKGQKELIEACHILKEKDVMEFHLLLVGKGLPNYVEELQELVRKYKLEENISFYGASSKVAGLYAQSDISFMCSSREAYGRVTIESQLSGCLVIGVDSGATPELIEDGKTGYLYKTGDAQNLVEKILEAVNDGEKSRKIARNGQIYAEKTYTKEKSISQMIHIYEEVLGRGL